jgi:hypothetical protein
LAAIFGGEESPPYKWVSRFAATDRLQKKRADLSVGAF